MKQKIILFSLIFNFLFLFAPGFLSFSQEEMTLTTFYPSPFGVYDEMRSNKLVIGDPDSSSTPAPGTDGVVRFRGRNSDPSAINDQQPGALYYNSSDDQFKYHDGANWQNLSGPDYCYTHYSAGAATCPAGYTMKSNLGRWGYCIEEINFEDNVVYFKPAGVSCNEISGGSGLLMNSGWAVVCCAD